MKSIITNSLLALVSVIFVLLVLEFILRITNYENQGGWKFMLFDEELGVGPGLELSDAPFVWLDEASFDDKKNDHVIIRNQKVPFKKPAREVRIVSIGDSGTYGLGLEMEQSYPTQLENILKEKGLENGRVINAGMGMTTNVGQYNVLKSKLLKIHPDIVTVGIFMGNDLNINLSPQNFLGPNSGVLWSWIYKLIRVSVLSQLVYTKLIIINYQYHFFTEQTEDTRSPFRIREENQSFRDLNPLDYDEGEMLTYLKDDSPVMNDAYVLFEEILTAMKELAVENDFQLVIVIVPTPSTISSRISNPYVPEMKEMLSLKGIFPDDLDFDKPTRRVVSICKKLNLICIDPTDALKEQEVFPFLPNDTHLSEEGYRVVAQQMADCFDINLKIFSASCEN